jgi:hypothetical protein
MYPSIQLAQPGRSLSADTPLVVAAPMHGRLYGEVLLVRLAAGQIKALLTVADELQQRNPNLLISGTGIHVYALSAAVDISGARCWLADDITADDLPEEGTLLRPAPAEPDEAAGSWSDDYRLLSDGSLEISSEDDTARADVNLRTIWEQLQS